MPIYGVVRSSDYLAHYGIKGQKKGIRRWTNDDGTLTEEGKRRYYIDYQGNVKKLSGRNLRSEYKRRYNDILKKEPEDYSDDKEMKKYIANKEKRKEEIWNDINKKYLGNKKIENEEERREEIKKYMDKLEKDIDKSDDYVDAFLKSKQIGEDIERYEDIESEKYYDDDSEIGERLDKLQKKDIQNIRNDMLKEFGQENISKLDKNIKKVKILSETASFWGIPLGAVSYYDDYSPKKKKNP